MHISRLIETVGVTLLLFLILGSFLFAIIKPYLAVLLFAIIGVIGLGIMAMATLFILAIIGYVLFLSMNQKNQPDSIYA